MSLTLFISAGLPFFEKFVSKAISMFLFVMFVYAIQMVVTLLQKRKGRTFRNRTAVGHRR